LSAGLGVKKAAAPLLAIGLSLLATVAIVEVALRLTIARLPVPFLVYLNADLKDRFPATWQRLREAIPTLNERQLDREVGWTFKPHLQRSGRNEEGGAYRAETSDEGFFTPDVASPSTPQLITIGASFLATFYVGRPVQNVVRDELRMPVYNLAVGGWGPESYRAAYEKFAAQRRHDLVIVFTVVSDPSNVVNWRSWQAEDSSEPYMTWLQKSTTPSASVNHGTSWSDTHLVSWNLTKFVMRRSSSGDSALQSTDASRLEHFGSGPSAFDLRLQTRQMFTENDPEYFLPGSSYYPVMEEYFRSLRRLKTSVEAHHARLVLVWIPSKERVYIPVLPKPQQFIYITNRTGQIDALERVVSRFAEAEGVSFLDLTPTLVEHARQGEKLFFTVDGHWNARGQDLAGKTVAQFIEHLPANPPEPHAVDPPLLIRDEGTTVERSLTYEAMTSRSSLVRRTSAGWSVSGRADSQFGYLAQWPAESVTPPRWFLAAGVLRRGGFSVGLQKDAKWALQFSVTTRGRFQIALPVTAPGQYVPVVANALPDDSRENDFDIAAIGWASAK
jgi:hypothetical protein